MYIFCNSSQIRSIYSKFRNFFLQSLDPDCYQLAYNKRTSFSKAVTTTPGKMESGDKLKYSIVYACDKYFFNLK